MGKYIEQSVDSEINQVEELIRETSVEVNFTNRIMAQIETESTKRFRNIKTRKKNGLNKIIIMMSTAVAAFVFMMGGSFISPAIAVSIKQIPGMASIFQLAGDLGLKTADEKGLVTKLSVGDTHNNLKLNVPVVMFDGTRVSIGLERETSEDEFSNKTLGELISSVNLSIDGRPIQSFAPNNSNSIGIYQYPGKDQNSVIIEFSDLRNQGGKLLPNKFNLNLVVTVDGIKDPFKIDIPVKKNIDDYLVMQPNISRKYENLNFTLEKFEFTPITTSITTRIDLPLNSKLTVPLQTMGVDVLDDKGNKLKMLSGNGWNKEEGNFLISDYRFQPFESTPEYITVKPYILLYQENNRVLHLDKDGNTKIKYIPELEITFPIGN
ncbi:MAG TPA: DUF4179 domain-containing protein [Bacillus bacterium]|nr:DUF4179 domain-containing protein [Bacillus sp. (in: firmicutes)]